MKLRSTVVFLGLVAVRALGAGHWAFDYDEPSLFEFGSIKSVSVAKLGHPKVRRFGEFQGYDLDSAWLELNAASSKKLGSLLEARLEEEAALYAGKGDITIAMPMCFDPGYAVTLVTDKGTRDFVICLHCEYVFVYDRRGHHLGFNPVGKFYDALFASYTEEFGAPLTTE
jgi:hypothetical protein